jgi:hypothetical protein
MLNLDEVQKANRELADRIDCEARSDPTSPYAGKFVGIANGQVVVVTEDLESLYYRLEEIEPDNRRVSWIEVGVDPTKIDYIWSC